MIKNNKSLNKVCKGAEEVRLYNLLWSIYLSCIGLFKGYSVCTKNWRQCRMLPEQASTADVISKSNHIPRIFFINFLCVIIGPRVIYLFVCFLLWLAEHLFTVLYFIFMLIDDCYLWSNSWLPVLHGSMFFCFSNKTCRHLVAWGQTWLTWRIQNYIQHVCNCMFHCDKVSLGVVAVLHN